MSKGWVHISLAILVLAQPAASGAVWAAMMAAQLDSVSDTGSEMSSMKMPGCHEAESEVPDCCDTMNGVACGMDCGTASPALNQPPLLTGITGHGAFVPALPSAAPASPPAILYKPPRTS